jgi:hypothetical protein
LLDHQDQGPVQLDDPNAVQDSIRERKAGFTPSYAHRKIDPSRTRNTIYLIKMNADRMSENDTYLVGISGVAGATGQFIWEICRGDGLLVLQRSTNTFPSRLEALFDAAQGALALDAINSLPLT